MKKAILASAVLCASAALGANVRGTISETQIKNLSVKSIAVHAEKHAVRATLVHHCPIIPIPPPPEPIIPEPVVPPQPVPPSTRHGCELPGKQYVVDLDTNNDGDQAIYQLLLKSQGSWSTLQVSLSPSGQLLNVELAHRPIVY